MEFESGNGAVVVLAEPYSASPSQVHRLRVPIHVLPATQNDSMRFCVVGAVKSADAGGVWVEIPSKTMVFPGESGLVYIRRELIETIHLFPELDAETALQRLRALHSED